MFKAVENNRVSQLDMVKKDSFQSFYNLAIKLSLFI